MYTHKELISILRNAGAVGEDLGIEIKNHYISRKHYSRHIEIIKLLIKNNIEPNGKNISSFYRIDVDFRKFVFTICNAFELEYRTKTRYFLEKNNVTINKKNDPIDKDMTFDNFIKMLSNYDISNFHDVFHYYKGDNLETLQQDLKKIKKLRNSASHHNILLIDGNKYLREKFGCSIREALNTFFIGDDLDERIFKSISHTKKERNIEMEKFITKIINGKAMN